MSTPLDGGKERTDEFAWLHTADLQDRTRDSMRSLLKAMQAGATVEQAITTAAIGKSTYERWRRDHPKFRRSADLFSAANKFTRTEAAKIRAQGLREAKGLVYDPDRKFPEKPGIEEFRWRYFGRPSLPHHQTAIRAIEDKTNRRVMIFMPTGAGKDTLIGDAVAWMKADSRGTNNIAWFMESQNHSIRRMKRLERYLVDSRMYEIEPHGTPGGQKPTDNLIADFGPFRWEKGMTYPDGTPVEQPKWTQQEMYFVGSDVNEADPDLWATGLEGALYGARIQTAVLSDVFTLENQGSAVVRASQLEWTRSTLESRLDARGRAITIGTMLPVINNYEALLDEWVPEHVVVIYSDEFYTKYSNGVAVVRHPAILEEGTEREHSFWEDRFPYKTQLWIPDGALHPRAGQHIDADSVGAEEFMELVGIGAEMIEGLVDMRGEEGTEKWRSFQATRQQQRVEKSQEIEFPDEVLALCDDYSRSYEILKPGDIVASQGVDPAKVYHAGSVTWVVNREEGTISVLDYVLADRLGTSGIRRQLLQEPVVKWRPPWLAFETNRHEGVLDDTAVQMLLKSYGVRVDRIHTNDTNRNSMVAGPGSLADDMRGHIIRFPMATPADRERTKVLKAHFKAWEIHSQESGARKTKPGQAGHEPDDLCMAAWVGYPKALEYLSGSTRRHHGIRQAVPQSIMRRFNKMVGRAEGSSWEPPLTVPELTTMVIENYGNHD